MQAINPLRCAETLIQHAARASDQAGIDREQLGVGMEQRKGRHVDVLAGEFQRLHVNLGEQVELGVRHHHALRQTRRPRSEHDRADVLRQYLDARIGVVAGVKRLERQHLAVADRRQLCRQLSVARPDHDARHRRHALDTALHRREQFQVGNDGLSLADVDLMFEEAALVGRVDRHLDRADFVQCIAGQQILQAVRHEQHGAIALDQAGLLQPVRQLVGLAIGFGECVFRTVVIPLQKRTITDGLRLVLQHTGQYP